MILLWHFSFALIQIVTPENKLDGKFTLEQIFIVVLGKTFNCRGGESKTAGKFPGIGLESAISSSLENFLCRRFK
jgi:hypothetical protein